MKSVGGPPQWPLSRERSPDATASTTGLRAVGADVVDPLAVDHRAVGEDLEEHAELAAVVGPAERDPGDQRVGLGDRPVDPGLRDDPRASAGEPAGSTAGSSRAGGSRRRRRSSGRRREAGAAVAAPAARGRRAAARTGRGGRAGPARRRAGRRRPGPRTTRPGRRAIAAQARIDPRRIADLLVGSDSDRRPSPAAVAHIETTR